LGENILLEERALMMTEEQIKYMINRFLGWQLPKDFNPDGGISAKRPNYAPNVAWEPCGTNLFTAIQAEAMVRYMAEGMPTASTLALLARRPIGCPRGDRCSGGVVLFGEGKEVNTCGLIGCMHNYNPTLGGCGTDHVVPNHDGSK
jgi:hypothetical protein